MKARIEFEVPDSFNKGDYFHCPESQKYYEHDEVYKITCHVTGNLCEADYCPLELISTPGMYDYAQDRMQYADGDLDNIGYLSEEAQQAFSEYLSSISVPTGINIFDL